MEKIYKNKLGGWSKADDNHSETHLIMSVEEYSKLLQIIKEKDIEINELIEKYEDDIENINQEYDEDIAAYENKKHELINQINVLSKEIEQEKLLNKNLLRINKEKSNQDRELRPRKEHSGYIIMSSTEKEISYKEQKKIKKAIIWETNIQTPYTIDMTVDNAKKQIFRELLTSEYGAKLSATGIRNRCIGEYSRLIEEERNIDNTVYDIKYKANFSKGYWECIIKHTLPLITVPKEMLSIANHEKIKTFR